MKGGEWPFLQPLWKHSSFPKQEYLHLVIGRIRETFSEKIWGDKASKTQASLRTLIPAAFQSGWSLLPLCGPEIRSRPRFAPSSPQPFNRAGPFSHLMGEGSSPKLMLRGMRVATQTRRPLTLLLSGMRVRSVSGTRVRSEAWVFAYPNCGL